MEICSYQIQVFVFLIILYLLIPKSNSVLSFTYPQATTLGNKNILVVEKDCIYICNPDFNTINKTLYTFLEEDKISSEASLNKTIIKKSSLYILIFSNYKLYIIDTPTGELLYYSNDKIFNNENPDYYSIEYSFLGIDNDFYFSICYLGSDNCLKFKYYKYNNKMIFQIQTVSSFNSISFVKNDYNNIIAFNIQNKGLSCITLPISDNLGRKKTYIICFVIGKYNGNNYLIPIFLDKTTENIILNNAYIFDNYRVNNVNQIKSIFDNKKKLIYVCYTTIANKGYCIDVSFNVVSSNQPLFEFKFNLNSKIEFQKNCRTALYGMKVEYIFEKDNIIIFSCSDTDGSIQVYFFNDNKTYYQYENCISIYGYSIIYTDNYYVPSDVICPEGIIPYNLLISSNNYTQKIVDTTNKEIIVESTLINDILKNYFSTVITDKNIENNEIYTTDKYTDKITNIITEDVEKETTIINKVTTEQIEEKNDCPEMCSKCDSNQICIKCNKDKSYYPIELTSKPDESQIVECITKSIQQSERQDLYFDSESESFKPCFEKCATCYGKGDGKNNNCKTCSMGYIFHPDYDNSKNCVPKPNSLYYIKYGQYIVTDSDICPEGYDIIIEQKRKCIEECKKDNKYIYTYDGLCYESPPENTNDNDGDLICKDNPNTCIVTKKKLKTLNDTITKEEIEILISKYAKEYDYTNYHISIYENNIYIITIYKRGECISELSLSSKIIDFGDCYNDIKTNLGINEDINLIIVDIETKQGKEKYKINPFFGLYNPNSGNSINYKEECKEQKITIQSNLTEEFSTSKVSLDDIKQMADQGIDLFDPNEPFYNDICIHYPDVLGKDIPLKKRVLAYYPDVELCDDNCELIYVFLNNLTSKCECSMSEEESKDKIRDNTLYQNQFGELEEFIYQINIYVMKCYKDIFKYKYFIKCYGGFIILGIIFIEIICTLIYFCKSRFYLKKYFFCVIAKYSNYLKKQKSDNKIKNKEESPKEVIEKFKEPPRKINRSQTKSNLLFNKSQNQNSNNLMIINNFNNIKQSSNQKKIRINSNNNKSKYKRSKKHREINLKGNNNLTINNSSLDNIMMNDDFDIDIKEFLITDLGDMDYDEALRRDNRSFCKFYCDKIFSEQIILNTFCNKEYLKPLPIKIILLVLQIDLYLLINGLFYNEEYVNKKFELESDSFSKAIWRFLDNLFYAFLVGVIINYIIEFFFIEEKKIRVTLKREKDNIIILR